MKGKILLSMVLLSMLILAAPAVTLSETQTGSTWVRLVGEITSHNGAPAFGWCGAFAEVGEWALVYAAWSPSLMDIEPEPHFNVSFTFSFYAAWLVNTTMVALNYSGADLYIEGLWNFYNITFVYGPEDPCENYTLIMEPVGEGTGEGTFSVIGNWSSFVLSINGLGEVTGTVMHYRVKSEGVIPLGDICGPNGPEPDNRVDIWDLVHAAKAYGSTPGMPGMCYDFGCDFNFDFQIDIYDLTTIAANIGEHY